jgi:dienelactone hydrolase
MNLSSALASPSATSPTAMTEATLRDGVAALGHGFNEAMLLATRQHYRASVIANLRTDNDVQANVSYGPAERHRLDVYSGRRGAADRRPVIVFVHGGGFVAGDKHGDPEFYANIGHYFANAGFVAVLMNYRLAPGDTWPSGPSDVRAVIDWIKHNAPAYGGDPERVFVMGQSAGGAHVAAYLFDPEFCAHATKSVTAAILLNGVYRMQAPLSGGTLAYFGGDATQYDRRSSLTHVAGSRVPLMIGASEFDPAMFTSQAFALGEAVTLRDGRSPVFLWMRGHNHVSCVLSLGSVQDDVGQSLLDYMHRFVPR